MKLGLTLSFVTTALFALFEVFFRYAVVGFGVHPMVFTCLAFFVAATTLVVAGGPGKGGLNTLRLPHTWAFGILEIVMNITVMFALMYVTATQMNFLARATIPLALIVNFIVFHTKPSRYDLLGAAVVCGGLSYIATHLPSTVQAITLFWMFWVVLASTLRTIIAEHHPESNKAETIRQRCRVTGYVLMVSSLCFLFLAAFSAYFKASIPANQAAMFPVISGAPGIADFKNHATVYGAVLLGMTVIPLAMYFYFHATKTAKSDVFIMVTSFLPFFSYFFEWLFSLSGRLDISAVAVQDLAAGLVMTFGAMVMLWGRKKLA